MALANLNINVNANVSNVVNAMADVKAVTHASMINSSGSVADFQKNFARESANVNAQSKAMGIEMKKTSVAIEKAASISADSISGISTSANATIAGVKELSKGLDAAGQEIKKAMGSEAAAQVKGVTDRVEEFIGTRVAIAAVGLALGAVAGTVAAVGFAAYKASGFMAGLITGESYKSTNIDALIATNEKVIDLQKSLTIAAQDANAMNDALSRLGINKSDVTTVSGNADSVLRGGKTSELDRLGVSYKGLDNVQVIENAKNKLDEYTAGWDRNSAAVALGFGNYEQMNNYLKLNQKELQNSKDRLDEYGLGIGPETQAAVQRYQAAMLLFNNETKLMGDGFKRVVADTIMPILTNFAMYLKDGWPSAVNFFRGVAASFSSILLGLDSAAYLAIKGTIASLTSFVDVTEGIVLAIAKLATGDVKGAKAELTKGWENAGKTMANTGKDMVAHAENTVKALKAAWAVDDRTDPLGMKPTKGLTFVAAPAAAAVVKEVVAGLTDAQKAAQAQIKEWLKTVWDVAATELAAEDFGKDVIKKLGILTPKNTGFTKNPAMNLGTPRLKSLEEIEAERAAAAAASATAAKVKASLSGMGTEIKMSQGDIYGAETDNLKTQQEARLAQIESFALKEQLTNEQKNALILKSDEVYAAAKAKLQTDTAKQALGSLSDSLASMGSVMMQGNKEQFEAGKKMAIAGATIDMTLGAVKAYTSMSGIPYVGPALGVIAAAAVVASGTMNIAKIQSQQYPGRELGGSVYGGTSYLVGERGPEIFTPGATGQITSNDKLSRLGGGQAVNITNVNQFSPGLSETIKAEMMRFVPLFNQSAVNAVKGAMRNGAFQGV